MKYLHKSRAVFYFIFFSFVDFNLFGLELDVLVVVVVVLLRGTIFYFLLYSSFSFFN